MPAQFWKVVGGADKGGIIVRASRETNSAQEVDRLSTGAVVRELALEGDRLKYRKLQGSGPMGGWVSTKLKNGNLLERTGEDLEPASRWKVVDGLSEGGITVQTGKDASSSQEFLSLKCGAIVRELELDGDRLYYELVDGKGPAAGWVNISSKDGPLLEQLTDAPSPGWEIAPGSSRVMPNLFAVATALFGNDLERDGYWRVLQELGYREGKNMRMWSTREDITDNVSKGGFSRCSKALLSSVNDWMRETPPPHVLICKSRAARLVSRLIAEGHRMPPMLVINGMMYYQFIPHESFDSFEFWSPEIPNRKIDKVMRANALNPTAIPREIAPRVVLTSGRHDMIWGPCRFCPLYVLAGLAKCLPEWNLYWHEEDGHDPTSFQEVIPMRNLLLLAAYGKQTNAAVPRTEEDELRLSDEELSAIIDDLHAGNSICQAEADQKL